MSSLTTIPRFIRFTVQSPLPPTCNDIVLGVCMCVCVCVCVCVHTHYSSGMFGDDLCTQYTLYCMHVVIASRQNWGAAAEMDAVREQLGLAM